jgi:hypothetical protein
MANTDSGNERDLHSPRDIAREYKIKFFPLKKAIEAGRVPHVRIGRSTYIIRSHFQRWLDEESGARNSSRGEKSA